MGIRREKNGRAGTSAFGFSTVDISVSVHYFASVFSYFTGGVRLQLSASTALILIALGPKPENKTQHRRSPNPSFRNPAEKGRQKCFLFLWTASRFGSIERVRRRTCFLGHSKPFRIY